MHAVLIDEHYFESMKNEWDSLLEKSDADSLFLSWGWTWSWWKIYGRQEGDKLLIVTVYGGDKKLIGIAPLYVSTYKKNGVLNRVRCVQFLGSRVHGEQGIKGEYLQFITEPNQAIETTNTIIDYLISHGAFDEFSFSDIPLDCEMHSALRERASKGVFYQRIQNEGATYEINCDRGFHDYILSIGKNSRLKLFNRRKVLEGIGDVSLVKLVDLDMDYFLQVLNEFYHNRWGYDLPDKTNLFLREILSQGIKVFGVMLKLNGKPIGCTFDFIAKNRAYNVLMGYRSDIDKKISTGTLLLGYAIEEYCNRDGISFFDLLVGEGKHSNYKARISSPGVKFQSLQLVKSQTHKFVYKAYDFLKR
ncbi:GNAT family N-acetyltransferase [Porticoccus sp. GXU_MW_L64]